MTTNTRQQTQQDRYPSRVSDRFTIVDRADPVVWSDLTQPPAGPLSKEQLEAYDRDGFLFLPAVFSDDEVRKFRDELVRMTNDPKVRGEEVTVFERDSDEVRSIFEVHRRSKTFLQLMQDRRIADAARQIVASDVYIHQSRVNLKKELHGAGFFWHSDFETWHVEDGMPAMRALSASVALTENNEFNGPLWVIPGSHRKYVSAAGETPDDHYKESLKKQENGVPDAESLQALLQESEIAAPKGPAGSVLLFDCNIMHGSVENISPWPRSNVFFVYNSAENTLVHPFGPAKPRPPWTGAREFTPVDALDVDR